MLACAEVRGLARRRLSDEHEAGAAGRELITRAVQLDRVSLAIDSAVVAKPHKHDRAVPPQVAQSGGSAVVVGQDDVGQGGGGVGSGAHFPG
jgi:hypothetical protein